MAKSDDLLHTIEAVHAAGLDETCWPQALAATARLVGGNAAMLEVFAPPSQRPIEFHAFGIPPAGQFDYFEHYAALSPRAAYAFRHPGDDMLWDYKFIDEAAMDRDPYYAKLLPQADFRYFVSAKFAHTRESVAAISVQRTRTQGHVGKAEVAVMTRLAPHYRLALDTAMRLRRASELGRSFEGALDWLADGVALLARDGTILYANEALQAAMRLNDGISTAKRILSFATPEARGAFVAALTAAALFREAGPDGAALQDFTATRPSRAPSYLISVRPLLPGSHRTHTRAVAIVFVRDPISRRTASARMLRGVFGFTEAEARLAEALQSGKSLADYAGERAISLNTVYTHLRRIKEKTETKRMAELIRKLNDLQVPLRIG
jgi:DNA-binding CsgD family transcriptional regulator